MAKVFTGKVTVPGDQIPQYLEALEEAEREIEPFKQQLAALNGEFKGYLLRKYSENTARKHHSVIDLFIDFLCWHTDVRSIEEITRGMANSYFRRWYKSKAWYSSESELKTAVKKFFVFLHQEKGITNEAVLKSLKR